MTRMRDRRASSLRLIVWVAIAILATYCLFVGGGLMGIYNIDLRRASLVLTTVGIVVWVIAAIRDPYWRPQTVFAWGFAAALGVMGITTVTSVAPRLGVEYLAWSVLLTALYLILQRLMASPFYRDRIMAFATIAAFVIGIAFIVTVFNEWIAWWGEIGRIAAPPLRPGSESLTFGNPSAVMTASVLLTASAVAHVVNGSRRGTIVALAAVILTFGVTLLSGSRAGWLGLTIAIGATGLLWILFPDHRRALLSTVTSRSTRVVAMTFLIAGSLLAIVVGPGILTRASAGGEAWRTSFYEASLRMFESSPLVGLGPGTWATQRASFIADTNPDYYATHSHDLYLQTVAEFGILGVAAGLIVLFLLGRLLYGAVRDPDPTRRRVGWCALFATIYFGAHQLLDFYANAPAILFAFAIPIAWLDATARTEVWSSDGAFDPGPRRPPPSPRRVGLAVMAIAMIVGSVSLLAWAQGGAATMQQGTDALARGDTQTAVDALSSVVASDPDMPPYHFALGLALARQGRLADAAPHFLKSATFDGLPEAWLDLAAVRARLGDASGAEDALANAMRLGRQQTAVALAAGVVELELGDRAAALNDFALALSLSPSLAGDPWWTQDAARASVWPDAYTRAFEAASPSGRFELALETGNRAALSAAIDASGEGAGARLRLIADAWSGDPSALNTLEADAKALPLDGSLVNWIARIHRHLGNVDRSDGFRAWAAVLNAPTDDELRVNDGPLAGVPAGKSTLFYGIFEYRRQAPIHQLVPWLPHLVSL